MGGWRFEGMCCSLATMRYTEQRWMDGEEQVTGSRSEMLMHLFIDSGFSLHLHASFAVMRRCSSSWRPQAASPAAIWR